jgi:signal transduction histidine kinase
MPHLRQFIDALAEPEGRQDAARAFAAAAGCSDMAIYVRDPELRILLPAPGMPKTVVADASWRDLLDRCVDEGLLRAQVALGGTEWHAHALSTGGCAFVLLGKEEAAFPEEFTRAAPLLAAALRAQQQLRLGLAEAAESRAAAERAYELARALDTARASAAELNRQLRREDQRKDEFLAMLAHELRNPLAPVVSGIEILRRGARNDDERARRTLEVITRQLQQLTRLVDDLLDVSRVSRGVIELRREDLDLDDIVRAAVDATTPQIESRSHRLAVTHEEPGLRVNGDRVRLVQVFSNLLNNAAKYTEPGGSLRLHTGRHGAQVEVLVSDNGIGIPQDMLESIFGMFTQVPGSLDRAPGGLGIGLTLVRTLVELHGGQVQAHSDGRGRGSVFRVRLPAALSLAPAAPRDSTDAAPVAGAARQVLVVDDNVDAAESLAEVLRLMGAHVEVAHDGTQALDAGDGRSAHPDLVLLDIGLPGIDGFEVAREWRRRFGRRSRIVALTGYGGPEDRRRTAEAGFDGHLVKPVSVDQIRQVLDME